MAQSDSKNPIPVERVRFWRVKGNKCVLHWPDTFPDDDRMRGTEGYVVDLNDPLEIGYDVPVLNEHGRQVVYADAHPRAGQPAYRHVKGWCEGQLHKLDPAGPEVKGASPVTHPAARRLRLAHDSELAEAERRMRLAREVGFAPPERPSVKPGGKYAPMPKGGGSNFAEIEA